MDNTASSSDSEDELRLLPIMYFAALVLSLFVDFTCSQPIIKSCCILHLCILLATAGSDAAILPSIIE